MFLHCKSHTQPLLPKLDMKVTKPTWESKRETKKKNVGGCVPTIFSFLGRYHPSHSRRRLSSISGKKHKSAAVAPPTIHEDLQSPARDPDSGDEKGDALKRCGSRHWHPNVVARLMGLEELPLASMEESMAEKRKKLMDELEKCDRDLKALQVVIESLQVAAEAKQRTTTVSRSPMIAVIAGEDRKSVVTTQGRDKMNVGITSTQRAMAEGIPRKHNHDNHQQRSNTMNETEAMEVKGCITPTARNRETTECIEEICDDCICGERWECRRLAVALERGIFGDLVAEAVKEMGDWVHVGHCCSMFMSSAFLPFGSCRRRLCF